MAEIWTLEFLEILLRARNTAVVQVHCFVSRLDPFHVGSNHAQFQLNLLRNGCECLEILQCCMAYCCSVGSQF